MDDARWVLGTRLEVAHEAMKFNMEQLDIRISANNYGALYSGSSILKVMKDHPGLFADLPPIPQRPQVGPGYLFPPT